jgi:PilZ domain
MQSMVGPERPERRAPRYPFAATAQAIESSEMRPATVKNLSIFGAYLAMPDPFSKGAVILVKIRTQTEFFQCNATVAHSTHEVGMGIEFSSMIPAFRTVLQEWLSRLSVSAPQETGSK